MRGQIGCAFGATWLQREAGEAEQDAQDASSAGGPDGDEFEDAGTSAL